jgi:hypothetical protein
MSLIGIELNATRARAVAGPRRQTATPLRLENDAADLMLAVSLEFSRPLVGRASASLSRRLPNLVVMDFLGHLGNQRTWQMGNYLLDADRAMNLVLQHIRPLLGSTWGVAMAVPAYLTDVQVRNLHRLAEMANWPLIGSLPIPIAAALAIRMGDNAPAQEGPTLVIDIDGHAMTCGLVTQDGGSLRLAQAHVAPHLGRGVWLRRLLDGVSDRCVRLTRRDPRESADAEQSLYDQLDYLLEAGPSKPLIDLTAQAGPWFQQVMLHADEVAALTFALTRQAIVETERFLMAALPDSLPGTVILTASAARLPGLRAALEKRLDPVGQQRLGGGRESSDFGEDLLDEPAQLGPHIRVLGADVLARAAHDVAVRVHASEMPGGMLETVVPVDPPGQGPADEGPARLHFRGRDHLLRGASFTLGRDPSCNLVFDSELYPTVSARHCEILNDRRAFTLCDRSRHGTLLNERPLRQPAPLNSGDWIRLGPNGPVVRFLGQPASRPSHLAPA